MVSFPPPPRFPRLLSVALLLIVGCSDLTVPEGADSELETITSLQILPTLSSDDLDLRVPPGSVDRRFLEINRERPGFAGMYYDPEGDLVIRLTADAAEGGLVSRVEAAFQDDDLRITSHRVLPADFEWQELVDWRLRISSSPQWSDAITAIGIDERRNQVGIGVDNLSAEPEVREMLAELGVPDDAVRIRERQRITTAGGSTHVPSTTLEAHSHTLQHLQRPLVGGLRINHTAASGVCTYGASVGGYVFPAFITASHCTPSPGSVHPVNPHRFYQANQGSSAAWFAVEAVDPPIFQMSDPECSPVQSFGGQGCRHADAAIGSLDHVMPDSVSDQDFGVIARTTNRHPSSGPIEIDGQFYITGRVNTPLFGQALEKVGSTTGWTFGFVTDTCEDVQDQTGVWMLCQTAFSGGADEFDSGSPVFERFAHDYVRIAGILWGRDDENGVTWFSPMLRLDQHLGALDYGNHTPPPPPSVMISGPDSIPPSSTCTWNAIPSSGTPPYSFRWWNHNTFVSDSASYTGGLLPGSTGSSFTLTVEVEDDSGQTETDQFHVEEASGADPCLI